MVMTLRQAAEQQEGGVCARCGGLVFDPVIPQKQQEPVAWGMMNDDGAIYDCITPEEHARCEGEYTVPLYAAPQPSREVELTYEEIDRALDAANVPELPDGYELVELEIARAVIAAYKAKQGEDMTNEQPTALRLADALEAIHENNADSLLALNVIRQAGPELRRLHQSEREGWRYADELEQERKQLQVMLNQERSENEALREEMYRTKWPTPDRDEALLRKALDCLTYAAPHHDCIDAATEYERMSDATIAALRERLK